MTVQVLQRGECTACGRTIYAQGPARIIEAARTSKGEDLVHEYLAKKPWRSRHKNPLVREADVAIVFEEYARTGVLRIPRELNDLDLSIGLREIKAGPGRFPFYELTDQRHAVTVTRLTHGFTKGAAMKSLYDRVASKAGGEAALAAARLRREVLVALHQAFATSGLATKTEVARRLDIRRSAVSQVFRGDGNLRINTLAEYLFTLGFELDVKLVPAGEPRRAELEGRHAIPALSARNTTHNVVFSLSFEPDDLGAQTSTLTRWILSPRIPYRLFDSLPDSTSRQIVLGELVEETIDGS